MTVEEFMALPNRLDVIEQRFIPQNERDYSLIFRKWLTQFHEKHMVDSMDESRLTETQKALYLVGWNNCREKLAPDIEGNVFKSIIKIHELDHEKMKKEQPVDESRTGMEAIDPTKDDLTIVLEQLKFFGKDVNIVDMYKKFKNVHEKLLEQS